MVYVSKRERASGELLALASQRPGWTINADQERILKSELRIKFSLPRRIVDEIVEDMVITKRISREKPVEVEIIPAAPPALLPKAEKKHEKKSDLSKIDELLAAKPA